MNRVILVTAIGGDVGHGVLKCLSNTRDTLIGCDMNPYPAGLNLVSEFFISLPAKNETFVYDLLDKCRKYKVTHLIPISEPEIEVLSNNINSFTDAGIRVCINDSQVVQCFLDKFLTAVSLTNLGLNVPNFFKDEEFIPNGQKHIVKFRKSCGSKLTQLVSTTEELERIRSSTSEPLIVQEYIDEPESEYTVGVFRDGNQTRVISFRRKLQGGFTKFVELVNDPTITNDVVLIAESIGLIGSINVQLRKRYGKNFIFEINPRLSGTVHFRHLLGFDDVMWWLDILDDKQPSEYSRIFTKAIGVRELNEKFLLIE